MDEKVLRQSWSDLVADFDELIFLLGGLRERLQLHIDYLKRSSHRTGTAETMLRRVEAGLGRALENKKAAAKQGVNVVEGIKQKYQLYTTVRELTSELAGLVSASDWQSPSYQTSMLSQAGRFEGKIAGNITDYTRDQHLLGNEAQKQFGQAYFGVSPLSLPRVLFTSSGMAALTTILLQLMREGKLKKPILVGKNSYFQNQELLVRMFGDQIIMVDEYDLDNYKKLITSKQPSAVFVDSLTNSATLAVLPIQAWLRILKEQSQHEVYLVVDNTCLALGLPALSGSRKVKVIVWESLNKYYQFGLDRTTGGYIYATGAETLKLFYARMHGGTNLPDVNCSLLPKPQKNILSLRMKRMQRNASWLAKQLADLAGKADSKIETVVYPGLPNHPAYAWVKRYAFTGSSIVLSIKEKEASARYLKGLIGKLISQAKKDGVALVAGSSFGLQVTRIYLVAMKNVYSRPFLRISVGTETMMEMERLLSVFKKVLE